MSAPFSLPVMDVYTELTGALEQKNVILSAPPGAGKSTWLPLQLLKLPWLSGKKILMLQPRRVAVRAIAGYLAQQLGEPVGQTIGYRIRGETKVSQATRLEILTEGLLTRVLQQDPELKGVGLVIFDEFHERSLHADFSLALCLEVQQALREDVRLLVMSATLEQQALQTLLPKAQNIQSMGRSHPLQIHYKPAPARSDVLQHMAGVIIQALEDNDGSALAFLPGAGEIRRLAQVLADRLPSNCRLYCLFGELGKEAQMAAVAPLQQDQRKLVLATNIAETSLTIEGINMVIDSGLEKVARFDLNQGISHLRTQRISQASATQRAGRAGRLGPGICYRLWPQAEQSRLAEQSTPQILLSDMSPMILEAAAWGTEITNLALLDQPIDAQIEQGSSLLQSLQALDSQGRITPHGRKLCTLGCHPRLAHMLIRAKDFGKEELKLACVLAALTESKDPLRTSSTASVEERLSYLCQYPNDPVYRLAATWFKRLSNERRADFSGVDPQPAGGLLALAFPDRVAKSRGQGRYLMARGTGAMLSEHDRLARNEYLVIANLLQTGTGGDARISLAAPLREEELMSQFSEQMVTETVCQWQPAQKAMQARAQRRLGKLVLSSEPVPVEPGEALQQRWLELIRQQRLNWLPMSDNAWQFINRARLAATCLRGLGCWSESALLEDMENWLLPYLDNCTSFRALQQLDFVALLKNRLDWAQQQTLNELFPAQIQVPSGSRCKLDYRRDGSVVLAVRMQELYGWTQTPTLGRGQITIQLELLSPAQRPLQKTADLQGFWAGSYKEIQKEMKGRYPKHFWPDDPASAQATTKTKKKM
ncbi:ATP-dependent helicase HrpB [Lacimicrobium alkaliphilum]|uniref:ATP-dependent helicase HrpB n=1 Tax=Lacimicrobium alkaliphilum TaxID=1526571 RepID=A0ABQ1QXC8_9ALTE|nr:ATP-dependent helicase HrpB [Lacimicrobium alkaliphilum]GGD50842.1 ATP-dependent helicase HrpB [Lacimicrobium alkaliphilum]